MSAELPGFTPPECNEYESCPAALADYDATNNEGVAALLRTSANTLARDANPDKDNIIRLRREANGYTEVAKASRKKLQQLKASGKLCSICPFRK